MRARWSWLALALLASGTVMPVHGYMKEGTAAGKVIIVGEERVVVAPAEGGQMTFEARRVKHGEEWVADPEQVRQLRALHTGDRVRIRWGRDHTGHYYVISLAKGGGEGERPRAGHVRGKVIVVGEDRVVIEPSEGGQMTLEAGWRKVGGRWRRNSDQIAFFHTLKPGDEVAAAWKLDEGTHYIVDRIEKVGEQTHQPHGDDTAAQIRQLRAEVERLRRQVNELREQLRQHLAHHHEGDQ